MKSEQYEAGYKKGFSAGKNHKKKAVSVEGTDFYLGYQDGYKDGRAESKVAKVVTVVNSLTGKATVISPMVSTVKLVKRSLNLLPKPSCAWVENFEIKGSLTQMIRAEEAAKLVTVKG